MKPLLAKVELYRADGSVCAVVKVYTDGEKIVIGNLGAADYLGELVAKALAPREGA